MSTPPRSSPRRLTVVPLGVLVALCATTVWSAAARGASAPSALRQATGYSGPQLDARPACGAVEPGRIRCLAQVLTVKASGRTAPLLHVPHARPMRTTRGGPRSAASAGSSGSSPPAADTADFLQWAYDTSWLSANDGTGDTVAIVDAYGDPTAYSDMQQFRNANGLPALPTCSGSITTSCFEVVNQNGQTSPLPGNTNDTGSWNIEESLDIDAVSVICPLCRIIVVESNNESAANLNTGVTTAASLGANQLSLSWGTDTYPNASGHASPYSTITSAAILAASGDDSYPAPRVGYPAALAGVTSVGGTALTSNSSSARGFTETTWTKQTCADGSICGTESGCDTSQSKPSYQSGITVCTGRAYNDISADADPNTGLEIYDSEPGDEGCGTASNWCIVGGTSLATPLTAAFEAVAGISDRTPAWTYSSAALLNDVTSGSDGTCPQSQSALCTAGTGWDGPTGNGSINGDVVAGGPGIGLQPNATGIGTASASVSAEIIPNDSSPSASPAYFWQYGPTTSYGSATTPTALIAGTSYESATGTLSLSDPCTYHYRVVATNALGTTDGYDHTVTPTQSTTARTNTAAPTIAGTAAIGQQLTAQIGTWAGGFLCATTYQWQEAPTPAGPWTPIGGATSPTYTPAASDAGDYLEVVVTESNSAGDISATSQPTGQVPAPPAPVITTTPTTTVSGSTPPPTTTTEAIRFYRCRRTCVLINTHGATTYRPGKADYGRYIKIVTTLTRTSNSIRTAQVSTRWVGPVTSSTAGALSIGSGARVAAVLGLRTSTHKLIAHVRIANHRGKTVTLIISRQGRITSRAWAYVVSRGAVVSCTSAHGLGRTVTMRVAVKPGQTIKLVAVRT